MQNVWSKDPKAEGRSSCRPVIAAQVWDRRCMGGRRSRPAGVLVGHTEGVTHLDAKVGGCAPGVHMTVHLAVHLVELGVVVRGGGVAQ